MERCIDGTQTRHRGGILPLDVGQNTDLAAFQWLLLSFSSSSQSVRATVNNCCVKPTEAVLAGSKTTTEEQAPSLTPPMIPEPRRIITTQNGLRK